MDHEVIDRNDLLRVIEISKTMKVPVFVDDASGARLRTVVYKQPRAMDIGADIAITSTDKLMDGPRGGLMSGKSDIMILIRSKAHQFGLEAQPPIIAGMVRALENLSPEKILNAINLKHTLYEALKDDFHSVKETPTGIMITPQSLSEEIQKNVKTDYNSNDLAAIFAMLLLRDHGIITIPAVGMPGASQTIRIDMASKDAQRISINEIVKAFNETFSKLISLIPDQDACKTVLYQ